MYQTAARCYQVAQVVAHSAKDHLIGLVLPASLASQVQIIFEVGMTQTGRGRGGTITNLFASALYLHAL